MSGDSEIGESKFSMDGGSLTSLNAGDGGDGTCDVTIDALSAWTVTGNSTVTSLTCNGSITGDDGKSVTIAGTDGTVFVQGTGKYTITTGSYNE